MVEAREGGIEFFAGIIGETGAVARDEAVFACPPLAADVDRIVERGGADLGQESGFQEFSDEARADRGDGDLFPRSERLDPYPSVLTLRHSHIPFCAAARVRHEKAPSDRSPHRRSENPNTNPF